MYTKKFPFIYDGQKIKVQFNDGEVISGIFRKWYSVEGERYMFIETRILLDKYRIYIRNENAIKQIRLFVSEYN
jgi:hypothetical protein